MKIVIGGANGLLGKRLVLALRARGDEVVALVRGPGGLRGDGGLYAVWDGRTVSPNWTRFVEVADAVINLAGANVGSERWSEARKREILSSRIDSTRALVSAMRSATRRPAVFLCASAVGYYGSRGDEALDERAPPGRDFLAQVCAEWEAEANTAGPLSVRVVSLRTGVVLAPEGEGSALDQLLIPFKLFVGGPVGSGKQWFPWIHLDDEIAAILWALDHPELRGPLNLVSPGIATMGDFCAALGKALHRPSWLPVPAFAIRAAIGEFAEALLGGQRALPSKLLSSGFSFRHPALPAALAQLLSKHN
jgi:uncharacterized protein (TIGR01777 family)